MYLIQERPRNSQRPTKTQTSMDEHNYTTEHANRLVWHGAATGVTATIIAAAPAGVTHMATLCIVHTLHLFVLTLIFTHLCLLFPLVAPKPV